MNPSKGLIMLQVSPWSARECGLGGRLHGRTCGRRSHRCTFYRRESTDACSCYSCRRTPVSRNTLQWSRWTMKGLHFMPWADMCRRLTLLQMGQGDGSFLYLVPSSPLASSSSLFMCFGPVRMDFRFSLAMSVRANRRNPSKRCKNAPGCSALTWLSVCLCGGCESRILLSFMKSFTQWDSIWLPLTMPE